MKMEGTYNRKPPKVKVDENLKDMLLEFTMNALLDHPYHLLPYTQEYFNELCAEKSVIQFEDDIPEDKGHRYIMPVDDQRNMEMFRRERTPVIYAEIFNPYEEEREKTRDIYYPKTSKQKDKLLAVIKKCFLFKTLDKDEQNRIVQAMYQRVVVPNEYIIKQGDDGDCFYIIDRGVFDVFIDNQYISSYKNSGNFGELALMYNQPRSATVQAVTEGALWAIDRSSFRKILLKCAHKKRTLYEEFINKVPILQNLTPFEKVTIADALVSKTFSIGEVIFMQGEVADGMYFIESGMISVSMYERRTGRDKKVRFISRGEHFGELSLVTKKPRGVTVTAASEEVKCGYLELETFERLLGPCIDVMKRNPATYDQQAYDVLQRTSLLGMFLS